MSQSAPSTSADERRLHILFNRWVPNSEDFTQTSHALALCSEDISTIKAEITSYRLNTALAKRTNTPYLAPWETLDLLKVTVRDQNKRLAERIEAAQTAGARVRELEAIFAGHVQAMEEKDRVVEERGEAIRELVALLKEREESVMAAKETVDLAVEMAGKVLDTDGPSFWSITQGDKQFLWIVIVGVAAFLLGFLGRA